MMLEIELVPGGGRGKRDERVKLSTDFGQSMCVSWCLTEKWVFVEGGEMGSGSGRGDRGDQLD